MTHVTKQFIAYDYRTSLSNYVYQTTASKLSNDLAQDYQVDNIHK